MSSNQRIDDSVNKQYRAMECKYHTTFSLALNFYRNFSSDLHVKLGDKPSNYTLSMVCMFVYKLTSDTGF